MHSQGVKLFLIALVAFTAVTARRVSHGKILTVRDIPYLVQLRDQFGLFFCAGALVSPSHVVTSAQCLKHRTIDDILVVSGATLTNGKEGEKHEIENWSIPTEFSESSLHMDVAVIKLRQRVSGGVSRPVRPCSKPLEAEDTLLVSGWPMDDENSNYSKLYSARYPVILREQCAKSYASSEITQSMVCANDRAFLAGTPALRHMELCGIASWAMGDAPGVYTDVYAAKNFIENAMKQ